MRNDCAFSSKTFQRARVQSGGMQFDVLDPRTRLRHRGIRRGIQRERSQALRRDIAERCFTRRANLAIHIIPIRGTWIWLAADHHVVPTSMPVSSFPHISGLRSGACVSATRIHRVNMYPPPPSPPVAPSVSSTLIYFCINLFLFYLPTKIPAVAGWAAAASRRVATSTVNRKPCGIAAILSRMRVSTCTRRSYARRGKYGNAFTRGVFTRLSRNTESARGATLTVYKQP